MKKEIEIINIKSLNEEERKVADNLLNEYYSKIQRMIKSPLLLRINIKNYDKDGKKVKYSINGEAIFSGEKNISSSAWDYDFARTIHKCMKKIESEIEHKFHSSDITRKKFKNPQSR